MFNNYYDNQDPQENYYIIAKCGHEVYEGENLYTLDDGKTLCPDCMEELLEEIESLECDYDIVSNHHYVW